MHPDLQAIVDADRAARREVETARQRLAARIQAERDRLQVEHAQAGAAARARLDATIGTIATDTSARVEAHRAARAAFRERRKARADAVAPAAINEYVSLIRGDRQTRGAAS